jgi:hypothetical protein
MEANEKQAETTITVTKAFGKRGAGETVTEEVVAVRKFVVEPAKIGVSKGLTINLGNFESARIDVSIQVPCYAEEAAEAFEYASAFVEDRLTTERAAIRGLGTKAPF